jgi:hypothetical protein
MKTSIGIVIKQTIASVIVSTVAMALCSQAAAQEKITGSPFELGVNFSGITGGRNIGFGGGATLHLLRGKAYEGFDVALDSAYNVFLVPKPAGLYSGGTTTQVLFGVKAGLGDDSLGGWYIKARPGLVRFSDAIRSASPSPSGALLTTRTGSLTLPALDFGISFDDGIAWKNTHWGTRFDLGDTMVLEDSRFGNNGKIAHHFAYSMTLQYRF